MPVYKTNHDSVTIEVHDKEDFIDALIGAVRFSLSNKGYKGWDIERGIWEFRCEDKNIEDAYYRRLEQNQSKMRQDKRMIS